MRPIGPAFVAGVLVSVLLVAARSPVASVGVSPAEDFAALGDRARNDDLPILLVVSQTDCPYCKLLKREILEPMLLSGDYTGRVLIRELFIDSHLPVRDFDGRDVTPDDLAGRYRARLTPTVLFLDHRGQELAEPLIGINTVEFYGYYLDAAIDAARARLGAD